MFAINNPYTPENYGYKQVENNPLAVSAYEKIDPQNEEGSSSNPALYSRYESPGSKQIKEYYEGLSRTKLTPEQEAKIIEDERLRVQSQIDAINSSFSDLIREETRAGEARLGSTRAINARAGLIGSDFGEANKEGTRRYTMGVLSGIENRKRLAIQEVYGKVDERAKDKIDAENKLARENATAYIGYLQEKQTEARGDLGTLAKSGLNLDELSKEQFTKLMEDTGYDDFTLKAVYNSKRLDGVDLKYETKDGKLFAYGFNPNTQKMEFFERDLPAGFEKLGGSGGKYTEKITPDGTFLLMPENIDPNKPLDDQILMFGKEGQFKDHSSSTPTSYKEWELAGKPGTYEQWVKDGGGFGEPTAANKSKATTYLRARIGTEIELPGGIKGVVTEDVIKALETDPNFLAKVIDAAVLAGY